MAEKGRTVSQSVLIHTQQVLQPSGEGATLPLSLALPGRPRADGPRRYGATQPHGAAAEAGIKPVERSNELRPFLAHYRYQLLQKGLLPRCKLRSRTG